MTNVSWKDDPIEFSHSYVVSEPIDQDLYETFLFNLTSKYYLMKPEVGFITYVARDESHDWRINLTRNKFGHFEADCRNPPGMYDRSMVLV
jgi:hypothetical protein